MITLSPLLLCHGEFQNATESNVQFWAQHFAEQLFDRSVKKCAECWSFFLASREEQKCWEKTGKFVSTWDTMLAWRFEVQTKKGIFFWTLHCCQHDKRRSEAAASLRFQKEFHGIRPHRHWGYNLEHIHLTGAMHQLTLLSKSFQSVLDQEKG